MRRVARAAGVLACLLAAASVGAQGFEGVFEEEEAADAASPLTVTGEMGVELTYFLDDGWKSEVAARPSAQLDLTAEGETAEAVLALDVEAAGASGGVLVGNLVDELYLSTYFDFGRVTAGLTRIEWGTGDGLHAVDPLNATDRSHGPTANYLESRVPEMMIVFDVYLGAQGLMEMVYKPFFHPTVIAGSGRWAIVDASSIPGYSSVEPVDVTTLEYSQGAARVGGSVGPTDIGALYYHGYMPEAGYDYTTTFTGTDPFDPTHYTTTAKIVYTEAQLFGLDAAAAVGPFTVRGEAGYWLSEDSTGEDPALYNSRLVYLGGVDTRIAGTTLFVSAQVRGSYTFGAADLADDDVDRFRLPNDAVTSHLVVAAAEATFFRDRVGIRLAGVYDVETAGYLVMPAWSWTMGDDVTLRVEGEIIGGDPPDSGVSPYYAWRGNDNLTVSLRYAF